MKNWAALLLAVPNLAMTSEFFLVSDYLEMLDNLDVTLETQLAIKTTGVSSIRTAMITYSETQGARCWSAALSMHGDEVLGAMRGIHRENPEVGELPAPVLWSIAGRQLCLQHPDVPEEWPEN